MKTFWRCLDVFIGLESSAWRCLLDTLVENDFVKHRMFEETVDFLLFNVKLDIETAQFCAAEIVNMNYMLLRPTSSASYLH